MRLHSHDKHDKHDNSKAPRSFEFRSFWVPTKEAARRMLQAEAECWANIPQEELDGKTPIEMIMTPEGGRKAFELDILKIASPEMKAELKAQLKLREFSGRYKEAYSKSGGLLNLFAERVTEKDDEQWLALEEELKSRNFASEEEEVVARKEIENQWNRTPNELFSNLTPGQVYAGGGKIEQQLILDFMELLNELCGDKGYPSEGAMIQESLLYLRAWQLKPQEELGGKTPMEAIIEERNGTLNKKETLLTKV